MYTLRWSGECTPLVQGLRGSGTHENREQSSRRRYWKRKHRQPNQSSEISTESDQDKKSQSVIILYLVIYIYLGTILVAPVLPFCRKILQAKKEVAKMLRTRK